MWKLKDLFVVENRKISINEEVIDKILEDSNIRIHHKKSLIHETLTIDNRGEYSFSFIQIDIVLQKAVIIIAVFLETDNEYDIYLGGFSNIYKLDVKLLNSEKKLNYEGILSLLNIV